jgi:hypothetical protein
MIIVLRMLTCNTILFQWRGTVRKHVVRFVFPPVWHINVICSYWYFCCSTGKYINIVLKFKVYHHYIIRYFWKTFRSLNAYIPPIYMRRTNYTVFTVFRLLTDFVCLYTYEFWLYLCKIVRSSVILLLPLSI